MLSKQELKSSNLKELSKALEAAMKKLQELRIGVKTSHLKDTSAVGKHRHYIGRLKTYITQLNKEEKREEKAVEKKEKLVESK